MNEDRVEEGKEIVVTVRGIKEESNDGYYGTFLTYIPSYNYEILQKIIMYLDLMEKGIVDGVEIRKLKK